ncbi:MAG: SDR family NAD(P)-dependent oxidoreductase [Desulfobacteraceae bacterium]|nr:MAG: SDR family NAD(P)-dependent oxidoreductase [Desulfobacteraceae bacterium]
MDELTAVVTGGTRGIGLGLAEYLAGRGASVAVTYRSSEDDARAAEKKLEPLLSSGKRLLILKGDAGSPNDTAEQYRRIKERLGPVNVLVNNAGIMPIKPFDQVTVSDWDETIRVNLSGAFYWCAQVIPDMKAKKFGRIINIASIAARGGGVVGPHYAASKAGMLGLTRYGARELGVFGITVNAIAPAFIEDAGPFPEWSEERRASLKNKLVVPRLGTTQDVVRAFSYLLDSPFVTGVTLDVNGGAFMI